MGRFAAAFFFKLVSYPKSVIQSLGSVQNVTGGKSFDYAQSISVILMRNFDLGTIWFGPIEMEVYASWLIDTFVGVGAEIIPLSLEQVRRELFGAIAVVIRQGRHERGGGDPAWAASETTERQRV